MTKLTTINTPGAPEAVTAYSHAVKVDKTIYLSGQIALNSENKLTEGTITENAEQIFHNIITVLKTSNSSLEKVAKVTVYLADINDYAEFNKVYAKYFNIHKPARTCIAVSGLPLGAKVEMECIAVEND